MDCDVGDFSFRDDGEIEFSCLSLEHRDALMDSLQSSFPDHHRSFFPVHSLEPLQLVNPKDDSHARILQRFFDSLADHPDVVEIIHNANIYLIANL